MKNMKFFVAMIVVMMVGMMMVVVIPMMEFRIGIMVVAMMVVGDMLLYNRLGDMGCLQSAIKKRMLRKGYACRVENDKLLIMNENRQYMIQMVSVGRRLYQVYVMFGYDVDGLHEINEIGQAVMNSHVNLERPLTMVIRTQKEHYCSYVGAVRNVKDFMRMFKRAERNIMGTLDWVVDHIDEYKKAFPVTMNGKDVPQMGFVTDSKNDLSAQNRVVVKGFMRGVA